MKRARPVASLARSATTVELVRLGGGWTGDHARFAKLDPYRAQTSPRKRAELTRIAYMLEALPAARPARVRPPHRQGKRALRQAPRAIGRRPSDRSQARRGRPMGQASERSGDPAGRGRRRDSVLT